MTIWQNFIWVCGYGALSESSKRLTIMVYTPEEKTHTPDAKTHLFLKLKN